jgi:AraC-like DNA-binding protein
MDNLNEVFMSKAYDFVKNNISNNELSIEEFGKQLLLSRTQLYRKIKALTGMSPSVFVSTLRLKVAAELLTETSLSVSGIAYKVGFGNPSYFTSSFKKLYGVSPKEYTSIKKTR